MSVKLTRPAAGATMEERKAFAMEFNRALDTLGIPRGGVFAVGVVQSPSENAVGGVRRSDPSTSTDAALANFPNSGGQRHAALEAIAARGLRGATRDELQRDTGLDLQSLSPRVSELKRGGWVEVDGERASDTGTPMEVYVLTAKGRGHYAPTTDPAMEMAFGVAREPSSRPGNALFGMD